MIPDVMERTLLDPLRLANLARLSIEINNENVDGCVIEVGVYRGGSARWLAEANPLRRIYAFDTFTGLPHEPWDLDGHSKGDFAADYHDVLNYLAECWNVKLIKGIFPDVMPPEIERVALAHIDVDLEQSARESIIVLWPKLSPGGFIVFDDYNAEGCAGVKRAVDEMFPGQVVIGPHPQAWVRKPKEAR